MKTVRSKGKHEKRNSTAYIKVREEQWGGGTPAAGVEIPLQPGEKIMEKQVILQPMENHDEADTCTAPCGGSHAVVDRCVLQKAVSSWRAHTGEDSWQEL